MLKSGCPIEISFTVGELRKLTSKERKFELKADSIVVKLKALTNSKEAGANLLRIRKLTFRARKNRLTLENSHTFLECKTK